MDSIQSSIINNYPSVATYYGKFTAGSGVFCAAVATEMALRVFKGAATRDMQHLSADLSGALVYGICATNTLPSTAALGALYFGGAYTLYKASFSKEKLTDNYYITQAIRYCAQKALNALKWTLENVAEPIWNRTVVPVYQTLLEPLVKMIANLVRKIFEILFQTNLFKHPMWWVVGFLVTAIIAKQLFWSGASKIR